MEFLVSSSRTIRLFDHRPYGEKAALFLSEGGINIEKQENRLSSVLIRLGRTTRQKLSHSRSRSSVMR